MSGTGTLFPDGCDDEGHPIDPRTLSRREDPWTSHAAAHAIDASGALAKRTAEALARLTARPGSTASELDPKGIGSILAKRLNDLRKLGLAETRGTKVCSVTGRHAQVWFPAVCP